MAKLEIYTTDDLSYGQPWKHLLLQCSYAMSNTYSTVPSVLPLLNTSEAMQMPINGKGKLLLLVRLYSIHN